MSDVLDQIRQIEIALNGGAGSGNFGHAGRPGKVGGSRHQDLANKKIPSAKIPPVVYVGIHEDWYYGFEGMRTKAIREHGLSPANKTNFKHEGNRRDSVYVSASSSLAATYANLYSDPLVLEIDTRKLDLGRFYYDPLDIGDLDNPIQMAYRGSIPVDAIRATQIKLHGGAGSGNFGHAGRPGKVGGSQTKGGGKNLIAYDNLDIRGVPSQTLGYRGATNDEIFRFRKMINSIPERLKALGPIKGASYKNSHILLLHIKDNAKWAGETRGLSIFLGDENVDTEIGRHEFMHWQLVSSGIERELIGNYNPPFLFYHAQNADSEWGTLDEQLVMMLDGYDDDREKWVENVLRTEPYFDRDYTKADADAGVSEVERLLKDIGRW